MDCNKIIQELYEDKTINKLLSNIDPVELQEDLKQEVFLYILEMDCAKLKVLKSENNLLPYVLKIIWNTAISTRSKFYFQFKKNNLKSAFEYLESLKGIEISFESIKLAEKILNDKLLKSAKDAHESIIFQKWVELKSHQAVADYFGIPRLHVLKVCNNTKEELKTKIKNNE